MGEAAVAAAKAVGYVGAGTVEFIAEGDHFFFMEMNTRLQVEHPVTEAITGLDLVEWQLRVAAGEKLPRTQDQLRIKGHAIEARVYAENPEKGFLPAIGTLSHLRFPEHATFAHSSAVRVDSGVRQGDAITPFYDPMIAKLIVWGEDRQQALARMAEALGQTQIVGLSTNVAFLKRLVESKAFSAGDLDTGLIAKNHAELFPEERAVPDTVLALATAAVLAREGSLSGSDPWSSRTGWRVNQTFVRGLRLGAREVKITYGHTGYRFNGLKLSVEDPRSPRADSRGDVDYQLMLGDQPVRGTVVFEGETLHVFHAGQVTSLALFDPIAHAGEDDSHGGKLVAPMPGKIVALLTPKDVAVKKGAALLVMEAMKMEHTITAPSDGAVSEFLFSAGDQVAEGAELLKFTAG
jgi:3-methylcrotonyl-CoA carboxylase alpha subunit